MKYGRFSYLAIELTYLNPLGRISTWIGRDGLRVEFYDGQFQKRAFQSNDNRSLLSLSVPKTKYKGVV